MKRIMTMILTMLFLPGLTGCAETGEVWMYAVSAGKADAILLGVDGHVCLIDAGYGRSMGKIRAAMTMMGVGRLDAVFVTHTDEDHTQGLDWLARSDIPVGAWYASAMFTGVKEKKHPAVKAASLRGQEVAWLRAGDSVKLGSATLNVLAPSQLSEDKDDDNSLVMMLSSAQGSILLCGDMEFPEENILLSSGANLACDVVKIPNHADDDTASEALLRAARARVAVISTDSREKPETPDPRILAALEALGTKTWVTQDCTGGILVRLSGGEVSVQAVNLPEPVLPVILSGLASEEDVVTLENPSDQTVDLTGCSLYSARGGELFIFPDGTTMAPHSTLTVGTRSTGVETDLVWDDKKVIHDKKDDPMLLYDANGMELSSIDNGR